MLRNTVILIAMLLMTSGCGSTINQLDAQRQLPQKPTSYVCGELTPLDNINKALVLAELIKSHTQYIECQQAVNSWLLWYDAVNKSFSIDSKD